MLHSLPQNDHQVLTSEPLLQEFKQYLCEKRNTKKLGPAYCYVVRFYSYLEQNFDVDVETYIKEHLTDEQIFKYFDLVLQSYSEGQFSIETAKQMVYCVRRYLNYLYENQVIHKRLRVPYFPATSNCESRKKKYPMIITTFGDYMKQKDFSHVESHFMSKLMGFVKFIEPHINSKHDSKEEFPYDRLQREHIKMYEDHLWTRTIHDEIELATAYDYLNVVQHFLHFLKEVHFFLVPYTIPEKFTKVTGKRNVYVPPKDSIILLNKIAEKSRLKERDLAILLLLIGTGCRPIEIANLTIDDIRFTERTITLRSKKSRKHAQRTLNLDINVVAALKVYINIRKMYHPQCNSFFVTHYGTPVTSKEVGRILNRFNKLAFEELRHSPYAFRHTFATNAIDNNIDIQNVADVMGHNLNTTTRYQYRSKKRLLQNTLPFDPTQNILGDQ